MEERNQHAVLLGPSQVGLRERQRKVNHRGAPLPFPAATGMSVAVEHDGYLVMMHYGDD